jgi:hypothetical protein
LLINDASDAARVGDKYVTRREVRVTDSRYVQLLCFRNEMRGDF